jgi:hypothetical protein
MKNLLFKLKEERCKKLILSLGLSSLRPRGRREWGRALALTGKGWEWVGSERVKGRQQAGLLLPSLLLSPHKSPSQEARGLGWGEGAGS